MTVLKPTEFLLERDLKVSRKHYHLPGSAVYITTKACPEFTALLGVLTADSLNSVHDISTKACLEFAALFEVSTGELLNSAHGETNRKGDRRKL